MYLPRHLRSKPGAPAVGGAAERAAVGAVRLVGVTTAANPGCPSGTPADECPPRAASELEKCILRHDAASIGPPKGLGLGPLASETAVLLFSCETSALYGTL